MATSWAPSEVLLVRHLVEQGKNDAEIAEEFQKAGIKRTYKAIQRMRQRKDWRARVAPNPAGACKWNKPAIVEAERALVLFDVHVPFFDADWVNWCIGTALRFGCDTCIIGGDPVDFASVSKFGRQERIELEDEIRAGRQIIHVLASSFKQIVYGAGNHELRLSRTTDNNLALYDAMEMFVRDENVTVSDYHWTLLISNGIEFQVEHPKNISTIHGRVPAQLAAKYHRHILAGHGHLWGEAKDVSGQYWALDVGVCCDPERLAYNAKVHNTRPMMNQGAAMVLRGVPWLLEPAKRGLINSLEWRVK